MSSTNAEISYGAIQLGWPSLCLKAGRFAETLEFYKKLGFRVVGGQPEHGWATLANGPTAFAVMGFMKANVMNLRGGNVAAIAEELSRRGFSVYHLGGTDPTSSEAVREPGPRLYDPTKWPASMHTGKDGQPLPTAGAGDFLVDDPDGHSLYFDSVPVERARFEAGERFSAEGLTGAYDPERPRLGRFVLQLKVKDLAATRAHYERMGLRVVKEMPEIGYVEMTNETAVPLTLGFNAKSATSDVLYFECDDLASIDKAAKAQGLSFEEPPSRHPDGAWMAMLKDPEENVVFFRQPAA